jgi:hypothetical protein
MSSISRLVDGAGRVRLSTIASSRLRGRTTGSSIPLARFQTSFAFGTEAGLHRRCGERGNRAEGVQTEPFHPFDRIEFEWQPGNRDISQKGPNLLAGDQHGAAGFGFAGRNRGRELARRDAGPGPQDRRHEPEQAVRGRLQRGIVALETAHIDITAVSALRLDAGTEGLEGGQDALEGNRLAHRIRLDEDRFRRERRHLPQQHPRPHAPLCCFGAAIDHAGAGIGRRGQHQRQPVQIGPVEQGHPQGEMGDEKAGECHDLTALTPGPSPSRERGVSPGRWLLELTIVASRGKLPLP